MVEVTKWLSGVAPYVWFVTSIFGTLLAWQTFRLGRLFRQRRGPSPMASYLVRTSVVRALLQTSFVAIGVLAIVERTHRSALGSLVTLVVLLLTPSVLAYSTYQTLRLLAGMGGQNNT